MTQRRGRDSKEDELGSASPETSPPPLAISPPMEESVAARADPSLPMPAPTRDDIPFLHAYM